MSIYAEQHNMLLSSDVLDMIEQLQDDLKDDVDKVVEQLEDYGNEEMCYYKNTPYEKCVEECIHKAIDIVKGGVVDG